MHGAVCAIWPCKVPSDVAAMNVSAHRQAVLHAQPKLNGMQLHMQSDLDLMNDSSNCTSVGATLCSFGSVGSADWQYVHVGHSLAQLR